MHRHRTWLISLVSTLPGLVAGCAGGFGGGQGRLAEQRGEYHRAYDLYCQEAQTNPQSRLLALAMDRVAPQAANYWEDRAHQAVDRGDYAEAWRLFMRVLEIRPDHPSAPHLIRRLERDHASVIEPLRLAWRRRGYAALTSRDTRLAKAPSAEPRRPPRPPVTPKRETDASDGVARAPSPGAPRPVADPPRPRITAPARATAPPRSSPIASDLRPSATSDRRPPLPAPDGIGKKHPVPVAPSGTTPPAEVARKTSAARKPASPAAPTLAATTRFVPMVRTSQTKRRATLEAPDRRRMAPPLGPRQQVPTSARARSPFQFLVVRTLSKKDRRFPKKAEVLDGLTIEVRDTDDDPDADYYVYHGRKRIAKCKGVKIGEPRSVVGRSGRRYEVVLLSILDKRGTIRFGIRSPRSRRVR